MPLTSNCIDDNGTQGMERIKLCHPYVLLELSRDSGI